METGASVKITYWTGERDIPGIVEFRNDLARSYISVVQGRPGGRGLGLYELHIQILSHLSLTEVVKFLLEGITYDLIKEGTKSFVIRPFLAAYEQLKQQNLKRTLDIAELRFEFQDSVVIIYKISQDSVVHNLKAIFAALAQRLNDMTLVTGERPFEIHIPVFEDLSEGRLSRFRTLLDVDETIINITGDDYLKFWGLWYNYLGKFRVFDLQQKVVLDEEFYTHERYWSEMFNRGKNG